METVVTVAGNLVGDPTRRATPAGVAVGGFRLASTPRHFDRTNSEWKDGNPLFINVTCWRALADNVVTSLSKGDPVLVHGRLHVRRWTQEDGQERETFEIDATSVGPDLNRAKCRVTRRPGIAHQPAPDDYLDQVAGQTGRADGAGQAPSDPDVASREPEALARSGAGD
jgi:single-strand DNA-binding protein